MPASYNPFMEHHAFSILYEDRDIVAVNKLAPIPVQRDKSGTESLQDLLPSHAEAVHRIDQRASGIILFGKNRLAVASLNRAFSSGQVEKIYLACVERCPEPPEGHLQHWLVIDHKANRTLAFPSAERVPERLRKQAAEALLDYRLLASSDRYWFLEISLLTGRHHQIRAQLGSIGCPIKGDLKYGARRSNPSGRILLHAWKLAFNHPVTGKRLSLAAPLPEDEPLYQAFLSIAAGEKQDTGFSSPPSPNL